MLAIAVSKANRVHRLEQSTSQYCFSIALVTKTDQAVEIFLNQPSSFICRNLERVIPDWILPDAWVVIVLQQSRFSLADTAPHVEREKDRLREKFIRFGFDVAFALRDRGFLTDLIDPRTGYPLLSRPGEICHDDSAVVQALLGFSVIHNSCSLLEHPVWGSAVYPGILMSSASPQAIKSILKRFAVQHGWTVPHSKTEL